jgi:hypothetical protein
LVDIGVLEDDYSSEWNPVFPTFLIPKKNGKIKVKIGETDMILSVERFSFASALDLNMDKQLPMGIKIAWLLMFFKMSYLSLSKI